MKKFLSLFMVLVMALGLLAGCRFIPPMPYFPTKPEATEPPAADTEIATTDVKGYEQYLSYTLTEDSPEEFYALLSELEATLMAGVDWQEVERLEEQLDELAKYMNSQQSVAYILMSMDGDNETYSDYYVKSTEILTDIGAAYKQMARRVYLSDSAFKEQYFADWTQVQIKEALAYTDEVAELEKRNAQILVEYRALEEETMETDMIPLYREMVLNNNRIAALCGYDNYYEYAYELTYSRDYAPEKVQSVRRHVAEYIAPNFVVIANKTVDMIGQLSTKQRNMVSALLLDDTFDELSINYVDGYLKSLPQSAKDGMQSMFLESRAVFTDEESAHEGAFTTQVGDAMMCYFGPGYQGSMTAVHELGHFYALTSFAEVNEDTNAMSLDLAEVHSQANEWLFTGYLQQHLDAQTYETLIYYRMYDNMAGIIVQVCVDEFEELVYTHPDVENLTEADFDALMEQVCRRYGGIDFMEENITDIQWYWRMVVVESPVYYISYAMSSIAALDVYFLSVQDYDNAVAVYCRLIEQVDEEGGFLSNLERVGLKGPFEPDVYMAVAAMATDE